MIIDFLYQQILEYYLSKTKDNIGEAKLLIPGLTVDIGLKLNDIT